MSKRYNIVLDLDNTLISSLSRKEERKKHRPRFNKFVWENMSGEYKVFARPHLQEFLDFLFANFDVSVWTAASKSYAIFIIDNFILVEPERRLKYIFFSYHCKESIGVTDAQKSLSMLWTEFGLADQYSRDDTYIIDDSEEVCETQPDRCIQIRPFEFQDPDSYRDNELIGRIKPILVSLINSREG